MSLALVGPGCLVAGLLLGAVLTEFRYDDLRLGMGGGRHPGDHPICVLRG